MISRWQLLLFGPLGRLFLSGNASLESAWVQAFLKAARLMGTVLSIATTARETMSMSRIADLQYDDAATAALGTNSYRLIKQTFQSVCALFFFSNKKMAWTLPLQDIFSKLLGAQGLMIMSKFFGWTWICWITSWDRVPESWRLAQRGSAGLQPAGKKVAKMEADHQRSIAPTEKVCVNTMLRTAELVYLQTFAMWTSICVSMRLSWA